MFKKIAIGFAALFLAWAGLAYYFLRSSSIETLMICSTNPHVAFVPGSLCKYYTLHYRGDKKDIVSLEKQTGLAFIFSSKLATNYFLDFLVRKGIDINKVSQISGGTPLLSAVVFNKPNLVKYLLAHGANPSIKTNDAAHAFANLTPLQVAEKMQNNAKSPDRSAVITLLKEHSAQQ